MRETILFVLVFVVLSAVIVGLAFGLSYITGKTACDEFASRNPQYNFQYTFWNGCLVELPNGMWLSASKMNWVDGKITIGK